MNNDSIKHKLKKKIMKKEKQKDKKKSQWYTPRINSSIYISNLPKNTNEQELISLFSKCGLIRRDPETGENRIKIYKNKQTNELKGDAVISFLREESILLAIEYFNDYELKGNKIKVEKAKFEQKGDFYQKREQKKIDDLQKFKYKTDVNRLLGWEEEENEKGLKIVVLKNVFEPVDFVEDPELLDDMRNDFLEECLDFGDVEKLKIFNDNEDGIIKIKFKTPSAAARCIDHLKGRFYNGRQIEALYWDGKTDYYKKKENTEEEDKRIEEFGEWLAK
jgi:RNA recognition motif-containing protein